MTDATPTPLEVRRRPASFLNRWHVFPVGWDEAIAEPFAECFTEEAAREIVQAVNAYQRTAGPCEISGGPCEHPDAPTALYLNPAGVKGTRALCAKHANMTKGVPADRAQIYRTLEAYQPMRDALQWILSMMKYENKAGFVVLDHPGVTAESVRADLRAAMAKAEGPE